MSQRKTNYDSVYFPDKPPKYPNVKTDGLPSFMLLFPQAHLSTSTGLVHWHDFTHSASVC
jgi:hypothetical protein